VALSLILHASNVRCPNSSSVYNSSTLRVTREIGISTLLRLSPLVVRAQVSEQFWETVLVCTGSTAPCEMALLLLSSSSSLESVSDKSSLESCTGSASGAPAACEGVIAEIEGIMGALEGVSDGLDGPLLPRGLLFLLACVSGESLWVRSGSYLLGLSSTRSSSSLMVLSRSAILKEIVALMYCSNICTTAVWMLYGRTQYSTCYVVL
jgi:hypothetical protein